jgi:hypothetical protein
MYDKVDTAFIDLNKNAGLDWSATLTITGMDNGFDQRAKNLVTTGILAGFKSMRGLANGYAAFSLFGHKIHLRPCWRELNPGFVGHTAGIVVISITAGRIHPHHWFDSDTEDMVLLQFGLWLQVVDSPGVWLKTTNRAIHFGGPGLNGDFGPARQAELLPKRERWAEMRKDEALIAQTLLAVYALGNMEVEA